MTLLDLMELYQIKHNKAASLEYLVEIINEGEVNALIDRTQLAVEILRQCGARTPRYNTTDTFKIFGVNFFKLQKDFINRTLLLIAQEYNALDTYSIERTEKIDRKHREEIDETRTDNLTHERTDDLTRERTDDLTHERTDDLTHERTDDLVERKHEEYTDEHYVSAENESGVMLRTRDTHSESDGNNDGIFNTGTQTTTDSGTQTTTDSGTQTLKDTGTQKNEGDNQITHDDKIVIGEHGYKISPNVEFFNALKRNEYNLYTELASKFSDIMCLCVF